MLGGSTSRRSLALGLGLWSLVACARADEFWLASGGCIQGEWLNKDQQPVVEYVIRTEQGITLRLTPGQVREAVAANSALAEFRRRERAAENTAEARWRLAEWCRTNGLAKERLKQLDCVVTLDANHQQARQALGHQYLNGQWVRPKELRESEGFVYYRGRWRTPQEVDSIELQAKRELAQKEWLNKLKRWRNDLGTERTKAASESLLAVRDPVAVKPLAQLLAAEKVRSIKQSFCDILANIGTSESVGVLVQMTLHDPDIEMFHHCLDKLVALRPANIVDPYVEALLDPSNARVQRAALALGRFQDPNTISPLIDALSTKHLQQVGSNSPFGGLDSQTFSKSSADTPNSYGNAAVSRGESAKLVVLAQQNEAVLAALTKITGASFGFDQRAWRYWHAQEKKRLAERSSMQRRE